MTRRAGFTLVELIAALVLVGLVAAIVAGTLRLGVRAQERLLARTEAMEDRRVVLGQLRRHLEAAEPMLLTGPAEMRIAFQGSADQVWFAAEMPGGDGAGGIWLVRLALMREAGGFALALDRRLLDETAAGFAFTANAEHGVLLHGLNGARFSYSDGRRWLDRWDDSWRLPAKIRVMLDTIDDGVWPELIVAPAVRRLRR